METQPLLGETQPLQVRIGQCSVAGSKPQNQDFHGAVLAQGTQQQHKGMVLALADGISSSDVSGIASETAVSGFLADYYSTSEAWSIKHSAFCVLAALNAWLYAQTRNSRYRYDHDRGYVCTFSALILKSASAHVLHVGDAQVLRWRAGQGEQITEEHRVAISRDEHYLSRALGVKPYLECDYHLLDIQAGDILMLATDGVHEFVPPERVQDIVLQYSDDLDRAAQEIVQQALANGSDDNLTLQLVWVDAVPLPQAAEVGWQASQLPLPPTLCEGAMLDGYRMLRPLYQSSRSHVWLAQHDASGERVVLKVPTLEMQQDAVWLEHFMLEGWVARRLNNPHVLQAFSSGRPQQFLYNVFEYLEAQTLRQWMHDNPQPSLEQVRAIAGQLVKGLRAFHRQQMLHQDFRPDNIMIDRLGLVKIIDFGAVRVAGLAESDLQHHGDQCLGTVQYSAPEYFIGAPASMQSDMFSLAVVLYEMLCGQLPYGTTVGGVRSARHLKWLEYRPLHNLRRDIPPWLDAALRRALQPDPARRYAALSEFLQALHQPAEDFVRGAHRPLAERDPLLFWKGVSLVLMAMVWVLGLLLAVH